MRILITGGAGFIGGHLAEALLGEGHQVLVLDDLSTGSIDNILHLKARHGFEYTIGSVFNEGIVAELVDRADVIFHLAAAVGVKLIVQDRRGKREERRATYAVALKSPIAIGRDPFF